MSHEDLKKRKRSHYGFSLEYRTRWLVVPHVQDMARALTYHRADNDCYNHMNNSVYSFLFVLSIFSTL